MLLWVAADPKRLPARVRERIQSPENEVFFSAASIWEVAIKLQNRRIVLGVTPEELAAESVRHGFEELPVKAAHAAGIIRLPLHHRDPFDRLLISQALYEPARLLTADRALLPYSDIIEMIV